MLNLPKMFHLSLSNLEIGGSRTKQHARVTASARAAVGDRTLGRIAALRSVISCCCCCVLCRLSHIEIAGAQPQKEDLLQSKIRSSHWYRYMYSLSKYRKIYSASQVVRQDKQKYPRTRLSLVRKYECIKSKLLPD